MSLRPSSPYSETLPLVSMSSPSTEDVQVFPTQPIRRKAHLSSTSMPQDSLRLSMYNHQGYNQARTNDGHNDTTKSFVVGPVQSAKAGDDDNVSHSKPSSWTPYALRLPPLLALLLFNAAILIAVVILHIKSEAESGLATDDGSAFILFEWRFAPTLVAVVYVFMWTLVVDNVNRTESFARMSRPAGSTAEASLLRAVGSWWSAFADSFPRRKNDRKASVVLFCAVLAHILGLLVISPLSSSLLSPQDTLIVQKADFLQPLVNSQSSIQPILGPITYFRTIGNILQNVTTSPWISNEFTVVPFWPDSDQYLLSSVPQNSEVWSTQGLVFEADLQCEVMDVTGPQNFTFIQTYHLENGTVYDTDNFTIQTVKVASPSGCEYGFAVAASDIFESEFAYWSNTSNADLPLGWQGLVNLSDPLIVNSDPGVLFNVTDACAAKQIMISAILAPAAGLQIEGRLCTSTYLVGTANIEVSTNNNLTSWSFDQQDYKLKQHVVSDTMANVTGFQESYLSDAWTSHLQQLSLFVINTPNVTAGLSLPYWGPATLIGALHEFSISATMMDPNLELSATTILKRAFGEAILESIGAVQRTSSGSGEITLSERRIVIVYAVAYVVETVLAIHLLLGTILLFRNLWGNRNLGVSRDIAFANTIASVVTSRAGTRAILEKLYQEDPSTLEKEFGNTIAKIMAGKLELISDIHEDSDQGGEAMSGSQMSKKSSSSSATPIVLRTWLIACLGSLLSIVLISIVVLYWYSIDHGLYQSFFTHRTAIDIANMQLGTLAPYSIIPTFVAVLISLWWGSLEAYFRRMQPYLTQARGPTPAREGSGVSYQSSYLLWAAFRALHRKHGLLALMCTGAFLTQVCK